METAPTPDSPRRRRAGRRNRTGADAVNADTYAAQVMRVAVRLAARQARAFDADDIAQRVVERFLRDPASIMARYPKPEVFAAVTVKTEVIDHGRRERAQRGQGVKGKRQVSSWEVEAESMRTTAPGPEDPAGEATAAVALTRLLALLDDSDRRIAEAHWLRGDKVGEIAADLGRNHATVSRRLRAIAERLRLATDDDGYVLAT